MLLVDLQIIENFSIKIFDFSIIPCTNIVKIDFSIISKFKITSSFILLVRNVLRNSFFFLSLYILLILNKY